MARKVKGSKQYRMKVVPHRPILHGVFSALGVSLLVLSTSAGAFFAGQYQISKSLDEKSRAHARALDEVDRLRAQIETLRIRATTAEQSVTIGEQASESVRSELVSKDNQIAELRQEIAFYRGIMAPAEGSEGVSIGRFSISEAGDGRYQYKLLVQQSAARHQVVTGAVRFTIVGQADGEARRYALADLSQQVESESIPLRFKYFQNIEGELQLPEGFVPEGVELSLKSSKRKGFNIDQRYGWLVQQS
ncbi:hypothetical protein Mag101_15705 [Microbulbifer agarilyticus]|uniref:Uncharacterized protein n=1 Tax=Microbulbifer agarilyticus TaxID=260552 RepID=A0A1Q2M9N0_9GAMM|nr:DUF6776 family protein [Microbulbifer agarilyticus]AQQ68912.1 hypothetical protein Mag101_15705 [Microbulbifer agarilyticus]